MYALLKKFRYLAVLDADAYFAKPNIPLHLLMGHWGWKPNSRYSMQSGTFNCCAGMQQVTAVVGSG
jgi:hypothetical protein